MSDGHEQSPHARIDLLVEMMENIGNLVQNIAERLPPTLPFEAILVAIPILEGRGGRSILEQFIRKKLKAFHRTSDTTLAEHWVMDTERIFRSIPMTDMQKIENASDVLKGEAQYWWVNVLDQGALKTWEGFRADFNH